MGEELKGTVRSRVPEWFRPCFPVCHNHGGRYSPAAGYCRVDIEDARAEIAQARRLVWEARRRVSYSKLWLSGFRERLFAERNPAAILDDAIKVTRADFGNVQLLDPESGALIPFVPSCLCG